MVVSGKLNIVVALPCEARVLLDEYRLSRLENTASWAVYANKDRSIHLIVSGIGKVNAAAAVGYLYGFSGASGHTCFLNLGIAGSFQEKIGEFFLVHKITDVATRGVFFPMAQFCQAFSSGELLTVDAPQAEYPIQELVDMEGSGFFQAATSLVTQEQIQAVKIVSDNSDSGTAGINPVLVISLFKNQLDKIRVVIRKLLELSANEFTASLKPDYFANFIERWHFTVYQQHQLRESLRRWQVLYPHANPFVDCQHEKSADSILIRLDHHFLKFYN